MEVSRQELADLAGTTIESCIRIMSRWGKEHVLPAEPHGSGRATGPRSRS